MAEPSVSALKRGNPDHEIAAIVAMIRSKAIKTKRVASIVEHVGSAVAVVQQTEADRLFSVPNGAHDAIGIEDALIDRALEDVSRWRSRGLDMRTVLDPAYPSNLRAIYNRPALLFVEGTWKERDDSRSLAVVGSREASEQGLRQAGEFGYQLASAAFTVVSGLARGIDAAAHRGALELGGRTVAVMGTGLDHRYPKENAALADRIVEAGGALVTHLFPHQGPTFCSSAGGQPAIASSLPQ